MDIEDELEEALEAEYERRDARLTAERELEEAALDAAHEAGVDAGRQAWLDADAAVAAIQARTRAQNAAITTDEAGNASGTYWYDDLVTPRMRHRASVRRAREEIARDEAEPEIPRRPEAARQPAPEPQVRPTRRPARRRAIRRVFTAAGFKVYRGGPPDRSKEARWDKVPACVNKAIREGRVQPIDGLYAGVIFAHLQRRKRSSEKVRRITHEEIGRQVNRSAERARIAVGRLVAADVLIVESPGVGRANGALYSFPTR
jgi:hypothetical protein